MNFTGMGPSLIYTGNVMTSEWTLLNPHTKPNTKHISEDWEEDYSHTI